MNYKIKIKNEKHSEKVQKVLFELGYSWNGKKDVSYLNKLWFGLFKNYTIGCSCDILTFNSDKAKEITLKDLKILLLNKKLKECKGQEIEKDTLVYLRDEDGTNWQIRYYSHFENGKHYAFNNQQKSTDGVGSCSWKQVVTKNPLK